MTPLTENMLTSFLVAGFRKTRLAKSPTRTQWKLFRAKTPGFIDNSNIKTCLVVYISKVAPTFQHRRETCSWGSSCLRLWNHLPPPLPVPDPPPASLGDNFQMKGREIIWAYNKVWMPQPAGRGFPASWNTLAALPRKKWSNLRGSGWAKWKSHSRIFPYP